MEITIGMAVIAGLVLFITVYMLGRVPLQRLQNHLRIIRLASGVFLVAIGVLVATGKLQTLNERDSGQFDELPIGTDEQASNRAGREDISGTKGKPDNNNLQQDTMPEVGLNVGQVAPDFQTLTDQGEPVSLSGLSGNVILLNFWATWCGPCRIEMPEFQRQFEQYSEQGFVVLAINNGESLEDVIGFREKFSLTFLLAMDEQSAIQRQYGIMSYPSTLLIDRDGRIAARYFGPITAQQIDQLLADMGFPS